MTQPEPPPPLPSKPSKKRGAPKGNTNALKHGLYAARREPAPSLPRQRLHAELCFEEFVLRTTICHLGKSYNDPRADPKDNPYNRLISLGLSRLSSVMNIRARLEGRPYTEPASQREFLLQVLAEKDKIIDPFPTRPRNNPNKTPKSGLNHD